MIHERKKHDFIKIQKVCSVKDTVKKIKRQTTEKGGKICKTHPVKDLYPTYGRKDLLKCNNSKANYPQKLQQKFEQTPHQTR